MSIIISYDPYQTNWYVGELYTAFASKFINKYGGSFVHIKDLANQNNEPFTQTNNGCPSIFNIYNLIVYNTEKNIGFLHSLSDYAPAMMDHTEAINKLNIKAFSFSSNFSPHILNKYKNLNIKMIPSFYILENWNDHTHIKTFCDKRPKLKQCYFNGLCYGHRQIYFNYLSNNDFFVFKNKNNRDHFKQKEQYFEELSSYKYGLSINGAAQICYRDLEYFGMNILCLREPMDIFTKDQLTENTHYKIVLDDYIRENLYNEEKKTTVVEKILHNISLISEEEEKFILHNANQWFINNVYPENQISFLEECVLKNEII